MCVFGPGQGVGVDLGVEEHLEGSVVLDAQFVVFVDEDLGEEGLVAEPSVGVVAAGVDVGAVGEESERVVEVGASVGVVTEVGVDTGRRQAPSSRVRTRTTPSSVLAGAR